MAIPIHISVPKRIKKQTLHKNVLFIDKTSATFVILPDKVVKEYTYPQDMVMDGDVMKKDEFRNAFMKWVTDSNIKVSETLCIVGTTALFEKVLMPNLRTKAVDTNVISSFIDSIPFQHTVTMRKVSKDGSTTVIVANRDLISSIYHGLEKAGFSILGMFPELAPALENATPIRQGDIIERAKKHIELYTLKNADQHMFELTTHSHKSLTQMSVTEAAQQPVQPWVAVMIVLLLVGGAVGIGYFQYFQARQEQILLARKRTQLLAQQQLAAVEESSGTGITRISASSSATPSLLASISPNPISSGSAEQFLVPTISTNSALLRVQILYTSQAQKLFDNVYDRLRKSGQYQISNQMSSRSILENRVLVSPSLDAERTTQLSTIVQEAGIQTMSKQATIDGYDVVIELATYSPSVPTITQVSPTP